LVATYNVSEKTAQHLMKKYGSKAIDVLKLTAADSSLKELLSIGQPFIKAEVLYTIKEEMATTNKDVLERRLGLSLRDSKAAKATEDWVDSVFLQNNSPLRIVANL